MKRCDYCAKEISYHEMYCNDDCQLGANKYYEKKEKFTGIFGIVNIIALFGTTLGFIVYAISQRYGLYIITGCTTSLAIVFMLLPFPVDNMLDKWKIKKAVFVTRIIGLGFLAIGMFTCVWSFLL